MSRNPEKEMQLKSRSTGQRSLRTLRQKSENQGTWHRKRGHERARVDRAIWTLSSDEHQRAHGSPLAGARGHLSTPGASHGSGGRAAKRRKGRKTGPCFCALCASLRPGSYLASKKLLIAAKRGRRGPERELGEQHAPDFPSLRSGLRKHACSRLFRGILGGVSPFPGSNSHEPQKAHKPYGLWALKNWCTRRESNPKPSDP